MPEITEEQVDIRESRFRALGVSASLAIGSVDQRQFDEALDEVIVLLDEIEDRFSPTRESSEVSALRRGDIHPDEVSDEMQRVLDGCRLVEAMTDGAFRPRDPSGELDPSGFVKGWAIKRAGSALKRRGLKDWCLTVGGDVQAAGQRAGRDWRIAIGHPEGGSVAAVVQVSDVAVATSGTRAPSHPMPRQPHIWDRKGQVTTEPGCMTVIGPSVDIADALATGCWALGDDAFDVMDRLPEYHLVKVTSDGVQVSEGFPYLTETSSA